MKAMRLSSCTSFAWIQSTLEQLHGGGQSKLKGDRKISLIDSVMEDCIEFLIQVGDYENFLNNSKVVRGRGPSQFEREEREMQGGEKLC